MTRAFLRRNAVENQSHNFPSNIVSIDAQSPSYFQDKTLRNLALIDSVKFGLVYLKHHRKQVSLKKSSFKLWY